MPLDPRMFLGIGGPVGPQAMLPPGFRPPGPGPGAQLMQPQGGQGGMPMMPMMGKMPGMGGVRPSTSGAEMPGTENDNLGNVMSSIGALKPNPDGTWPQPPMPTDIGSGQGGGGMGGKGSFMSWLRGLF